MTATSASTVRSWFAYSLVALGLAGASLSATAPASAASETISIPAQTDWVDHGWVLNAGPSGSWDRYLNGMLTASVVKRNGVYYLYYGGACCYSNALGSVTDRAIGVATSTDGINFTKYSGNPILTWQPKYGEEEGAVSSAAVLDPNGQIVLYYGANTEESSTTVTADSRIAVSSNGKDFIDKGIVLNHKDNSVWGSGDELFPIIAFQDAGNWFQYYLPNGTPEGRTLGVAWGSARNSFTNSAGARDGRAIEAWGVGGGAVKIADGTYALFINDVRDPKTEVRTVSTSNPASVSAPVEVYQWPNVAQFTVLLDTEVDTWFLYYRNADQTRYGVKTAPAGGTTDTPPPSQVLGLDVTGVSSTTVDLRWKASTDENAADYRYRVYRNGALAGSTASTAFQDTGLSPGTTYTYKVSAITSDGVEGPRSTGKTATTSQPPIEPPSKVTGLTVESFTSSSVDLVWKASTDPGSSDYRYRVYRGTNLVTTTSSTSYTDRGLTASTEYSYQVSALDRDGLEGTRSVKVWVTTADPEPPTEVPSQVTGFVIGDVTSNSVGLKWKASTDEGADTYRYRIYRHGQLVATTSFTSFHDGGLSRNTTYRYEISAVREDGAEGLKSRKRWATTSSVSTRRPFFADSLESGNIAKWSQVRR